MKKIKMITQLNDFSNAKKIYEYIKDRRVKVNVLTIRIDLKLPRTTVVDNLQLLEKSEFIQSKLIKSGSRGRSTRFYWLKIKVSDFDDDDFLKCEFCGHIDFERVNTFMIKCKSCNCQYVFNIQE